MRAGTAIWTAALCACGTALTPPVGVSDGGGGVDAGVVTVALKSLRYVPANVTVSQGRTVTWTNDDAVIHTVTSGPPGQPDGRFDQQLSPGASFSYTFQAAGSYPYFCRIHYTMGMVGSVAVSAPGTP